MSAFQLDEIALREALSGHFKKAFYVEHAAVEVGREEAGDASLSPRITTDDIRVFEFRMEEYRRAAGIPPLREP